MGADSGRYGYTPGGAELYGALGIEGTTYEIGFEAWARMDAVRLPHMQTTLAGQGGIVHGCADG